MRGLASVQHRKALVSYPLSGLAGPNRFFLLPSLATAKGGVTDMRRLFLFSTHGCLGRTRSLVLPDQLRNPFWQQQSYKLPKFKIGMAFAPDQENGGENEQVEGNFAHH